MVHHSRRRRHPGEVVPSNGAREALNSHPKAAADDEDDDGEERRSGRSAPAGRADDALVAEVR